MVREIFDVRKLLACEKRLAKQCLKIIEYDNYFASPGFITKENTLKRGYTRGDQTFCLRANCKQIKSTERPQKFFWLLFIVLSKYASIMVIVFEILFKN
jgi:hypothetical protein